MLVKNLIQLLLFFGMFLPVLCFGQNTLQGIVYDSQRNQRLGEVQIRNLNTQKYQYNDIRGEFRIPVSAGDVLVFKKMGFISDTVVYDNRQALIIHLKEQINAIEEVQVYGRRNPDDVLNEIKRDYRKAFELATPGDIFSVGRTGAGLNISSLYNMVSKEGRNAKRFTQFIGKLHEQNIVDFYFTPELVRNLIGLQGEDLKVFMQLFRPTYEFVVQANHYKMVEYIKNKYEVFKLHPNLRPLRELPDIKMDVKNEK